MRDDVGDLLIAECLPERRHVVFAGDDGADQFGVRLVQLLDEVGTEGGAKAVLAVAARAMGREEVAAVGSDTGESCNVVDARILLFPAAGSEGEGGNDEQQQIKRSIQLELQ